MSTFRTHTHYGGGYHPYGGYNSPYGGNTTTVIVVEKKGPTPFSQFARTRTPEQIQKAKEEREETDRILNRDNLCVSTPEDHVNEWSTSLFACFSDKGTCIDAFFCRWCMLNFMEDTMFWSFVHHTDPKKLLPFEIEAANERRDFCGEPCYCGICFDMLFCTGIIYSAPVINKIRRRYKINDKNRNIALKMLCGCSFCMVAQAMREMALHGEHPQSMTGCSTQEDFGEFVEHDEKKAAEGEEGKEKEQHHNENKHHPSAAAAASSSEPFVKQNEINEMK